ncbi:hypothetical protein NC652_004057 [Populus alba x Populus x berolinensis]|nr:hypothetical protein NC652_004057 [Populus alba x Populus x berolinensis]
MASVVVFLDFKAWIHKSASLLSDPYRHARFWADCIDMKIYPFEQNSLWASKGEVKELSKKNFIDYFKILEGEPGDKIYLPLIPSHRFFYSFETLENLSILMKIIGFLEDNVYGMKITRCPSMC